MHLGVSIPALLAIDVCAQGINDLVADYGHGAKGQIERNYKIDWKNPPKTRFHALQSSICDWMGGGIIVQTLMRQTRGSWLKLTRNIQMPEITVYVKAHNETSQNNWGRSTASLSLSTWTTVTDTVTEGWTVGGTLSPSNHLSISSSYSKHYSSGTSVTDIETQDVPCPPLSQCTVQTWTYHIKVSGMCERIPFFQYPIFFWWSWDPCDMKARRLCSAARYFIEKTCRVYEVLGPRSGDWTIASHRAEPCQLRFPIFDQAGKPFTETHIFTTSLSETPRAYEKHPDGWCWLDSGDLYRDDYDLYWNNEKSAWTKKPWATKPDVAGFQPCRKALEPSSDGGDGTGRDKAPKVAGKDGNGYCYLNDSHYYASTGKYWTKQRGWYRDADAPKPNSSLFEPCPGDEAAASSGSEAHEAVSEGEAPVMTSSQVPKVIGKDRYGYCYLNRSHYFAGRGSYWTKSRGWYLDTKAPEPDTSGFKSCVPRRLGRRPPRPGRKGRPLPMRNGTLGISPRQSRPRPRGRDPRRST
ncbi:hypothetical protein HRG_002839 [Hirsutella rhossiliensis]|uniref:Uncharacterized protein n=1 Tax=Hirsutella rhossiliensis TaxID=111463 RepID=A0A9P8MYP4_9HYPO|nr:uncharacterized protein HRG_02839 [Hirsutella rhossiliensis]KAH0964823.1 hypothetical protein HRG_02839 [Hirsutella rhossiliensis]